eukprot:sb/3463766/
MELRKQPDRKSQSSMIGEVQESVLCDYQEVGSFTPRPFLKTEQIMVDPTQIKTEPEDCKVFQTVGSNPGCIKCKLEKGEVDCKKEPGLVKMEPVSPVSDTSDALPQPSSTIPQEAGLVTNLHIPENNPCGTSDESQNGSIALPNELVSGKRKSTTANSGEGAFECEECGKKFASSGNLRRHSKIHKSDRPHECKECGKSFTRSCHLKIHQRIHSGEKLFKCEDCGKAFTQSSTFTVHRRIHTGERPYKCKECGKACSSAGDLCKHIKIHNRERLFKCKECEKTFIQSSHLRVHQRTHSGERPYQCVNRMELRKQPDRKSKSRMIGEVQEPVLCDYQEVGSFSPRPFLKTEQITVDPPQIKTEPEDCKVFPEVGANPGCIKCKLEKGEVDCKKEPGLVKMEPVSPVPDNSDASPQTSSTIPHKAGLLTNLHIPENNLCDTTDESRNGSTTLPNGQVSEKRKSTIGKSREGTFECEECGKRLSTPQSLKRHYKIHTGERPYKCKECGKAFNDSSTLAHHQRIHTGERPYQCDK